MIIRRKRLCEKRGKNFIIMVDDHAKKTSLREARKNFIIMVDNNAATQSLLYVDASSELIQHNEHCRKPGEIASAQLGLYFYLNFFTCLAMTYKREYLAMTCFGTENAITKKTSLRETRRKLYYYGG